MQIAAYRSVCLLFHEAMATGLATLDLQELVELKHLRFAAEVALELRDELLRSRASVDVIYLASFVEIRL